MQSNYDENVHEKGILDGNVHEGGILDENVHEKGIPDGNVHEGGILDENAHEGGIPDGNVHEGGILGESVLDKDAHAGNVLKKEEDPSGEDANAKEQESQGQKKYGVRDGFVFEEPEVVENVAYAGFWARLAAFLIDGVLVWLGLLLVRLVMLFVSSGLDGTILDGNILFHYSLTDIVVYAAEVVYFILFTYYSGTTLGKRALNLRVVNANGGKLSLWDVVYRETIGRFLCAVTIGIGYIFVAADKEKRGLHDMLCDTRVIYAKTMKIYPVYYTTAGKRVPSGGIAPNRGPARYGGPMSRRGPVNYGGTAPSSGLVNYGTPAPGRGPVNHGGATLGRGPVNSGGYTASGRPGNYSGFEERRGASSYGNGMPGKENAAYGSTLREREITFMAGARQMWEMCQTWEVRRTRGTRRTWEERRIRGTCRTLEIRRTCGTRQT